LGKGDPEVVMGIGILRLEANCLGEFDRRIAGASQRAQHRSESEVSLGTVRFQSHRRLQFPKGFFGLPLPGQ
jgi:hypothetical protein